MNKIQLKRLEKLITFCESQPEEDFDFAYFERRHGCGTTYCLLGYAPLLWPKAWEFQEHTPVLKEFHSKSVWGGVNSLDKSLEEWFGMTRIEGNLLFKIVSCEKIPAELEELVRLSNYSTRTEVLDNAKKFIEIKRRK